MLVVVNTLAWQTLHLATHPKLVVVWSTCLKWLAVDILMCPVFLGSVMWQQRLETEGQTYPRLTRSALEHTRPVVGLQVRNCLVGLYGMLLTANRILYVGLSV